MEFQEIEKKVLVNAKNYSEHFKVEIDLDFALLKLSEEVGEFAQAVLIHLKKSRPEKFLPENQSKKLVAEELADIVGMVMVNADLLGVNLEQAIVDKWIDKNKKAA